VHPDVDPAAFLLAVLVVAVGPLTSSGSWDQMNTIVAVVVGVLVVAFSWPRRSHAVQALDNWTCLALSTVYGLILTIVAAWPTQIVVGLASDVDCPVLSPGDCLPDNIPADASYWSLLVGLLGTVVVFFVLKARIKKLAGRVSR
jgi:hypothetical protein